MTIVVDTSVLIDHLRGDKRAHTLLQNAFGASERVLASMITRVEILAGMRADEKRPTHRLMDLLEWVAVDLLIANQAGAFARRYLRSHPSVDSADYIIAATAEAFDATLWTRNVRHFPMFQLQDPYEPVA